MPWTSWHRGEIEAGREGISMTAHRPVPAGLHTASVRLPFEGEQPSFGGATGWLNLLLSLFGNSKD
jgi:hypothetical protein